ncbi:hypothetical protein, partial [Escherichia coli]|uniref:hypothetical protein n=1 Tax=Escherichia coli TaxID=562 RepID=UPI001412B49B
DYECEIRYHPGKANVVADALSRKERIEPIRVKSLSLIATTSLMDQLREAQLEALKEENQKKERIVGQVAFLETNSQGLRL